MKIEIGKTYEVNPTYKKSVVEVEHWYSPDNGNIDVTICWRWGTWYVTPQDDTEVTLLEKATKENIELCISDFSEYEMRETWDGCSEDLEYDGEWSDEKFESFKEEYWEDRSEAMEKYGFDVNDCDTYICCEIEVTEVQ